jgi:hypothetical protein
MECMKRIFFLFLLCALPVTLLSAQTVEKDVLGIVLSVKGELLHTRAGKTEAVKPSTLIFKDSVVSLKSGAKSGKIQIGTMDGPVTYKRFPCSFKSAAAVVLSRELYDNYMGSIGGVVLRSPDKSNFSLSLSCMQWELNPLLLTDDFMKDGFSLVIGNNEGSNENLSLNPLYVKLQENTIAKSVKYSLYDITSMESVQEGDFTATDHGFSLAFGALPFRPSGEYILKTFIETEDAVVNWDLTIEIYDQDSTAIVLKDAGPLLSGKKKDFDKAIVLAGVYRKYNLLLKSLQILKDAGIDLDGLL